MLRPIIFASFLLLLVARPTLAAELDFKSQIDSLALPLLEDGEAVGFVIGIVKDGQTQVISYGEKTKGAGVAPDGDTVYEIGSISKAFTGTILADMVAKGEIALDDPVQKYLPDGAKMPVKDDKPITIEHLATHFSGLPRLPDNLKPADMHNPYADFTWEQAQAFLGGHTLRRPPGEYEYSNFGMGLLGYLLAKQKGVVYESLLTERVCRLLDMNDTMIALSESQRKRLAPPYDADPIAADNWDMPMFAGAGGIRSTVNDMVKLVCAGLADDKEPVSVALHQAFVKKRDLPDGREIGIGWHIARDGRTRYHDGMTGGYASWVSLTPDMHFGVVLLSNTASDKMIALGEMVTRVVAGDKVEPLPRSKVVKVDRATLDSYAGKYAITFFFGLTVTVEDDKLMVQATGQEKCPVFAESPTKFFYKVVDANITFEKDKDGKVDRLTLHQNGKDIVGVKQ